MVAGSVGLAVDDEFLGCPGDRELGHDLGEHGVGGRIAPEDEVALGDVLVLDLGIVLHRSETAELTTPFEDGALHLGLHPAADLRVERLAGRSHEGERVHEGVVDRTGESMLLGQDAFVRARRESPLSIHAGELGGPRTFRGGPDGFDVLAVDFYKGRFADGLGCEAGGHVEGQRGDILGLDDDVALIDDLGVDPGRLPMALEAIDLHPVHAIVTEEVRHEADLPRHAIAASGGDDVEAALDFGKGFGVELMSGLGTDDVRQLNVLLGEITRHDVGGLLLSVNLTAVSDGRGVGEIHGDVGRIIPSPEGLLPRGDAIHFFGLEHL